MNNIVNMTPHDIVVSTQQWVQNCGVAMSDTANWPSISVTYPASGETVRLDFESHTVGNINGFDISKQILVGHNLPDEVEGTYLLVSAMVLAAFPDRSDLLAPDTSNASRNDKGHIISVPGFVS